MICRYRAPTTACLAWAVTLFSCIGPPGRLEAAEPPVVPPAAKASSPAPLTLAGLEAMALQKNPTLVQAAAHIEMSRGKAQQAGLYPNPTVGPFGDQIGARNAIDERVGAFIEQEIVTAGKLRLSRAKYNQEAYQAELQALAQQLRVVNGLHAAFYDVLATQKLIGVQRELAQNAEDAVKTTEDLVNVGQANPPDSLQARVEANRAQVALRDAEKRHRRDWEHLATLVGDPELRPVPLAGALEGRGAPIDREAALCRLLQESPELKFAQAEVVRDQIGVRREQVEPIPNVLVRGASGYNFETRNVTTDVQMGVRLPLFDRNQGTIRQAQGELMRAQAEVTRVELTLRRRFADAYHRYEVALDSVKDFEDSTLPAARKAFEAYQDYFKKRRATWPQVLVAERTYFQLQQEYISALAELRRAEVEINGLLLSDGLTPPPEPTPQGHIEATPKPR
jgi:cobalt-zinc-cadmium efflux system outer membrane protein